MKPNARRNHCSDHVKDDAIFLYGGDILACPEMQKEKEYLQHGTVSVYQHSVAVTELCLKIVRRLRIPVDERALVRGALLHDYFLYDWHDTDPSHRLHGFRHPRTALRNADRDFPLGNIERNMILRHMFPLTPLPPVCREGVILCIADKICAVKETVGNRRKKRIRHVTNR